MEDTQTRSERKRGSQMTGWTVGGGGGGGNTNEEELRESGGAGGE